MTHQEYYREYYVREYCSLYCQDIFVTKTCKDGREKQCSFARLSEEEKEKWIKEWSKIIKGGNY